MGKSEAIATKTITTGAAEGARGTGMGGQCTVRPPQIDDSLRIGTGSEPVLINRPPVGLHYPLHAAFLSPDGLLLPFVD
jgi:hypothetical protein